VWLQTAEQNVLFFATGAVQNSGALAGHCRDVAIKHAETAALTSGLVFIGTGTAMFVELRCYHYMAL